MILNRIPVVDLFAGPGGLSEGFSLFSPENNEKTVFDVVLSVEKDKSAHCTLELRSFFRKFPRGRAPQEYYEYIREKSSTNKPQKLEELRRKLFEKYPLEAEKARCEAWHAELGKDEKLNEKIDARIDEIIANHETKCWGIIGGPPCQAYSVIGRSRNKGKIGYTAENDQRSYLYHQYLRVIARHKPDFFIMENVKGMLSAKLNGKSLFDKILDDLTFPEKVFSLSGCADHDLEYQIYSLAPNTSKSTKAANFLIESEQFGIPQARHRVILLGVRKGFSAEQPTPLKKQYHQLTVREVLDNLPRIRSGLSREKKKNNTFELWIEKVREITDLKWFENGHDENLIGSIRDILAKICKNKFDQGSEYFPAQELSLCSTEMTDWYIDEKLAGVCNHTSKSHMVSDLHRYLYAASFAKQYGRSPLIKEFPDELIPDHKNARSGKFTDRFRVQVADKPSTTVTSHISKDGHYFIHYDPEQCRSLTVREAARLQTFPDNYFFEGTRTQQYIQVGNAVPPLLARQIAEVVYDLIKRSIS